MWYVRRTRRLDGQWPRDVAWAACDTWTRGCCGCKQLCAEGAVEIRAKPGTHNEADMGTKMVDLKRMTTLLKGTPLRPPMGWSSWLVASLPAVAEAAKDCRVSIWNVGDICETSGWYWVCVGMVIALLMVLSGGPIVNPISDDWKSTEGDRRGCTMESKGRRLSSIGPGSGTNHVADKVPESSVFNEDEMIDVIACTKGHGYNDIAVMLDNGKPLGKTEGDSALLFPVRTHASSPCVDELQVNGKNVQTQELQSIGRQRGTSCL